MFSGGMPAFNKAEIMQTRGGEWDEKIIEKLPGSELIVVDDCSTDETGKVLERLARQLPGLRPIQPPKNGGHGRALRFAFQNAQRDFIFQTDSDRQHLPADFWKLWERRRKCD